MEQNKQVYEVNLSLLKKNHPDLYKLVNDPELKPTGEKVNTGNNAQNLKVTGKDGKEYLMHGLAGPSEDAAQFIESVSEEATGVVVMMGFGLGYASQELLMKRPGIRHLVIFELDPGMLKQALTAFDLGFLLSDSRVKICLDREPVLNHVFETAQKALELEDIHILKHASSFMVNPEYAALDETIFSYLNSFSVRGSTTMAMGKKFVRNRLLNLKRIRNDALVDSLKGKFKNIPAILVSGGPSLNKNIDQLKTVDGKAVIFAVDSVVPTLLNKGILPQFISAIDPQKITLEKFKDAPLPPGDINLISAIWVAPQVPFQLPVKRVIWTFGGKNMEIWMNGLLGGQTNYIGAGTVAHLNLHAALDMGCNPIIFVGQDLAFSESRDHADDVSLGNKAEMEGILNSKYDWRWVEGVNGDQVKTSRAFFNHKAIFEYIIDANPQSRFINATEGGAHIEGSEILTLKEVLNNTPNLKLDPEGIISKHINPLNEANIVELDNQLEKLMGQGNNILKLIKQATSLSAELQKNLNALKKKSTPVQSFPDLPIKLQKQINRADKLSAEMDQQDFFWHILDEVTFEGLKESERMLHNIQLDGQNQGTYLDWIIKNLKRLDYISGIRKEIIIWLERYLSEVVEFHVSEKEYLSRIHDLDNPSGELKRLCQFYFDHRVTALASRVLDKCKDAETDPELLFIQGCSAALCGDVKTANQCFEKAVTLDKNIQVKIEEFKSEQAEDYYQFGLQWKIIDRITTRRLIEKGLQNNLGHPGLTKESNLLLNEDITEITDKINESNYTDFKKTLTDWIDELETRPFLAEAVEKKKTAALFSLTAKIFVHEKAFQTAYDYNLKAIELDPENPAYYVQMTDLCFTVEDFDKGVMALNTAVELDRSNAKLWEVIGDHMAAAGSLDDALSAYKKCLREMPENIIILKKMGDIYQTAEKPEAADEAYRQYERLLKSKTL